MSGCASSVIPNCPQRERGGCCLKPDGQLDCLPADAPIPEDASVPPELVMSIPPDYSLPDMSIEPPADFYTPPEDKSIPVDMRSPEDMGIPVVNVTGNDLIACGFSDLQLSPVNNFADALVLAQNAGQSYYMTVQARAKPSDAGLSDAGVLDNNCIRLCG